MNNENEILTIAGKQVRVLYVDCLDKTCQACVFNEGGCYADCPCAENDRDGKYAYFVEAEQPEEKDYKKLYEELVNSKWYKKYYQGTSVGDFVTVEQPQEKKNSAYSREHRAEGR